MESELQKKLERRASLYSIILVVIVSAIKTVMIFFTNSVSYRSEFMDSLIDIAIVFLTFISLRTSRKPADADHMFGHYKINSFMGMIESFLTMGLYGYILYSAIMALINYNVYKVDNPLPSIFSLIAIIIVNIFISTQIVRIGRKSNNAVIKAQGVNFRGDLFRNIAVIGALIGAYFNINLIDPILAILAVIYAFYESIKIIRISFNELIDYSAIDPDRIENIKNYIKSIPEISSVDHFAVRTAGRKLELAVKLMLQSKNDLGATHDIIFAIKKKLGDEFIDYEVNSFIEIMNSSDMDQNGAIDSSLFEKIRRIGDRYAILQDIHHLSIDRMENMLLIQFHINANKNESLKNIHEIVSKFEDDLKISLFSTEQTIPIEILSHIEPIDTLKFSNKTRTPLNPDILKDAIQKTIGKISEIIDYRIINLLEESNSYFLSVVIFLEENMSIFDAHLVAELFEINLKQSIPELHSCVVHTEPYQK